MTSLPVTASHTLAVLSADAVTIRLPSFENDAANTPSEWPIKVRTSFPEAAPHTLAVLSHDPVTIRLPSGENEADLTRLVWPVSGSRRSDCPWVIPAVENTAPVRNIGARGPQ